MMKIKTWMLRCVIVGAGMACMAPGCNGDVLKDPTFHLWSDDGKTLHDWTLDVGAVKRVPTWHPNDYGVELTETPTQISQGTDEGSECMEFSAVADVEASSLTKLQLDFNGDGVIDSEFQIPETHWRMNKTLIFAPEGYGHQSRFMLRKDGPGRAVLAEIRVQRVATCAGARLELKDVEIGGGCKQGTQCASGTCCRGLRAACCTGGANTCPQGVACATPKTDTYNEAPMLCGAGQATGTKGDPCINANDCASHTCDGTVSRRECFDGGACAVSGFLAGHCR